MTDMPEIRMLTPRELGQARTEIVKSGKQAMEAAKRLGLKPNPRIVAANLR